MYACMYEQYMYIVIYKYGHLHVRLIYVNLLYIVVVTIYMAE